MIKQRVARRKLKQYEHTTHKDYKWVMDNYRKVLRGEKKRLTD